MAERWRARLGRVLNHELSGRQPLVLYASHPDFEQTNVIQGELGEGTGGVTEAIRRRIVLPLGGPLADTDHVIGHELVHAYPFDMTTNPNAPPGRNGAQRAAALVHRGHGRVPVDRPGRSEHGNVAAGRRPIAGRQDTLPRSRIWTTRSTSRIAGVRRSGPTSPADAATSVIAQMLAIAAAAGDTDVAIEKVLGIKTKQLSDEWQASIRQAYRPVLADVGPPGRHRPPSHRAAAGLAASSTWDRRSVPTDGGSRSCPTRSVFSIDLFHRGDGDRADRPQADEHGERPALHAAFSSSIPPARGMRPASGSPSPRSPRAARRWRSSTAQSGKKEREITIPERRRNLQPDVGAGRTRDRVHRHDPRPD